MPKGVGGLKSLFSMVCLSALVRNGLFRLVLRRARLGSSDPPIETNRCGRGLRHTTEKQRFKADSPPGHATFPQQSHEQAWAKCRTYRDPGSDRGHAAYLGGTLHSVIGGERARAAPP